MLQSPAPLPSFHPASLNIRTGRDIRIPSDPFHCLAKSLSDILGPSSGIDSADVNPQDLINLMSIYISKEQDWQKYALSDPSRAYTRNLVDKGNGKSNLMIVVWNPGRGSPIHDHANAHCVMKILRGTLKETLYGTPTEDDRQKPLQITKDTTYGRDQVTYIADDIGLHKISNPSDTETAVSLHLYTPPHASNFGFNLFDEKTGKCTHIKPAGFFSEGGRHVNEVRYGTA